MKKTDNPPAYTPELLAAAQHEIDSIPPEIAILHARGLALRKYVADLDARMLFELSMARAGSPGNQGQQLSEVLQISREELATQFAHSRAMLAFLENTAQFQLACEVCEPLLAQRDAIEAARIEAQHAWHRANQAVNEAEETAKRDALAAVANDPKLAEMRAAVAVPFA